MLDIDTLELRDRLVLTRDISTSGARDQFFARVKKGDFVPLIRGVYMETPEWREMDESARVRARAHAVLAHSQRDLLVSHHTAAAFWRLPWFGPRPTSTHVTIGASTGGRSNRHTVRHSERRVLPSVRINGVRVTTLERTVLDVCRTIPFASAVVVADAALRRTEHPLDGVPHTSLTSETLFDCLTTYPINQGTALARRAITFADGAADRPGESLSRVNIALAGLTAPRIQVVMYGRSGTRYVVDFWWEEFNLIGEFDGDAKYTDPEFLQGRTPEQALIDEKRREDDLRAANHGMSRWPWETAISMPKLRRHLVLAGVR